MRIFPLYFACLLLLFVALPLLARGGSLLPWVPWKTQVWYWTYTSNWLIGVFGWLAAAPYTSHFWSLAVEEQFYLVWPAVMRRISRRTAIAVCLALMAVALGFRCWLVLVVRNPTAAWVLTPARMDALAVGALVALMSRGPRGLEPLTRHARLLGVAGLGAVVGLLLWRHTYADTDRGIATVGYTLIALAWGALLVVSLAGGMTAWVLRTRVMRWCGQRSYAMYVFHYPIVILLDREGFSIRMLLGFARHEVFAHAIFLVVNAGLTALAAELSWRLLESRMLRLKERFA